MVGLNKLEGKDRRRHRLRNHVAKDLMSPKYRQQVVPSRKRVDSEDDDSYYFTDEYEDDELS
jgi:hypothetical protein